MTGCSWNNENIQPTCVYPKFPSPTDNVKIKLKNINDKEINQWINKLVILKEKLEYVGKENKDDKR